MNEQGKEREEGKEFVMQGWAFGSDENGLHRVQNTLMIAAGISAYDNIDRGIYIPFQRGKTRIIFGKVKILQQGVSDGIDVPMATTREKREIESKAGGS